MILNIIILAGTLAAVAPEADGPRRLVSLLDYLSADYGGAVAEGRVRDAGEYREMLDFSRTLAGLGNELQAQPSLRHALESVGRGVQDKVSPEELARRAAQARALALAAFPVPLAPRGAPDRQRARTLFQENCRLCHGDNGRADTATADRLHPRPRNFHDEEAMSSMTPFRAYNALTLGVAGTAMPSWATLSEDDRWSLAYFVFAFRFSPDQEAEGRRIWNSRTVRPEEDFESLAQAREDQIFKDPAWASPSLSEPERRALIAFLRGDLSFQRGSSPLETSVFLLSRALEAARGGKPDQARDLALDAYLRGFEPVERGLASQDPGLVRRVESGFQEFRAGLAGPQAETEARGRALLDLLRQAGETQRGVHALSPRLALAGAFAILLREGLEAVLIIATILALLRTAGSAESRRYVHGGWILALAAGGLTWALAQSLIRISGLGRELLEGLTALLAAGVLVYVSWWLHSRGHVQGWKNFVERTVRGSLGTRKLILLGSVSFLAVYREAFETILFYQALLLENPGSRHAIGLGALAGILALALISWLLIRMQMRLPLKLFFGASSFLLYGLAVVLAGKGVSELQEAGYCPVTPFPFPRIEFLGIHPSLESLAAQGFLLGLLALGLSWSSWIEPVLRWSRFRRDMDHIRGDLDQAQLALNHVQEHAESLLHSVRARNPNAELREMDGHLKALDGDLNMLQGHMKDLHKGLEDYFETPLESRNSAEK